MLRNIIIAVCWMLIVMACIALLFEGVVTAQSIPSAPSTLVSNGVNAVVAICEGVTCVVQVGELLRITPSEFQPEVCNAGNPIAFGTLYVDSSTNELCFCDGISWVGVKNKSCE